MKSFLQYILFAFFIISTLIGINGCGDPGGPKFRGFNKPQANQGLLYIYRPNSFGASMRNFMAYDKTTGKYLGDLENGTYIVYSTTPGKKSIAIYEKAWNGKQNAALVATNLLSPVGAVKLGGASNKPVAVYTVNIKSGVISCLKWDATYIGLNSLNGVVDIKRCAKDIVNLHKR